MILGTIFRKPIINHLSAFSACDTITSYTLYPLYLASQHLITRAVIKAGRKGGGMGGDFPLATLIENNVLI